MRSLIAATFLGFISVVSAADPNSPGVNPIESARREFQDGKFDSALAVLDEAEKRNAVTGNALDLRGRILMEQGKFDEALKSFDAAFQKDKWVYAYLHTGDALGRQQKWEEARTAYSTGMKATDVLLVNERYRFGIFMTRLGAKDEEGARKAFEQIKFPTESAAYYYTQAAWASAHGQNREAQNWIKRAGDVFPPKDTAWFARHLHDFGWVKSKPPLTAE